MMKPTRLFPYTPPAPPEPTSMEKIRDATLTCCAQEGITATSFRMVADTAGVSIGAVQHHFRTKAALIDAVDQYVLQVIGEALGAKPLPGPAADALEEAGRRLTRLMAEHPRVMDYIGRALVEGGTISGLGRAIFDGLTKISEAQGDHFADDTRDDLDRAWAVLNPIILRVGAMILRPHIERYLRQPFYSDFQLRRWDAAVTRLIRHGLFDHKPESESPNEPISW
jgi:TetR/AcrR family transcriptional regulator, regulator of cefoperazone and chloramphenicol sensitivity